MPLIVFLTAFAISFLTVPLVIALAHNTGALAVPGKRHIHTKPTPKFGGIAIVLSVISVYLLILPIDKITASYIASSVLILMAGIFDDAKGANWKLKTIVPLIATSIIIFAGGTWIRTLGDLFGTGEISLGIWGIPFTYFAVFGIISAINLIDGLNGLACGVSSIAFTSFAIFAYMDGNNMVFYLSLVNLGATLGLFKYNYPKARIFMGDSGSLFLGLSLSVMAILLTQGSGKINPMAPVTVLCIPIFDTLRTMTVRLCHKKHPFKGDKTHLHHLMMRSGISPTRTVKIIWTMSLLMSLLAIVLHEYSAWLMLVVLIIVISLIGVFIENLQIIRLRIPRKRHKV